MSSSDRLRPALSFRKTGAARPDAGGRSIQFAVFVFSALVLAGVLAAVLLWLASWQVMPTVSYFPPGSLDTALSNRYGKQLERLGEPPLERESGTGFSLRILRIPAFEGASSVRYAFDANSARRRHATLQPAAGEERRTIVFVRQTDLPNEARGDMERQLAATGFWSMPVVEPIQGKDGSEVLVEALIDGRYHLVSRWSPGEETEARGLSALAALLDEEFPAENHSGTRGPVEHALADPPHQKP